MAAAVSRQGGSGLEAGRRTEARGSGGHGAGGEVLAARLARFTATSRSASRVGYAFAVVNAVVSGVAVYVSSLGVGLFHNAVLYTSMKNGVVGVALLFPALLLGSQRRRFRGLTRRDWAWLSVVAVVGGSVPYALFFSGLKMTTPVTGSLGDHLEFVLVAVFAVVFLKERFSPTMWAGMAVLLAGVLLSSSLGLLRWNDGTIFIAISTLLFSVEWVIVKGLLRGRMTPLVVMTAKMALGSAILFAYLAVRGELGPAGLLDWEQWAYVLGTGALLLMFTASIFIAIRLARVSAVMAIGAGAPLVTVALQLAARRSVDLSGDGIGLALTLVAVIAILVIGLRQEAARPTTALASSALSQGPASG
ncbi:MAG: EamA family transporter [Acidimicrobiales bacterium]